MACSYSNCHNGCGNSCTAASGDTGCDCYASCTGFCGGNCTGSASCSSCGKDCTSTCSSCNTNTSNGTGGGGGGCSCGGNCSGECKDACNTGCQSDVALDLYNKLLAGLDKKILATDMKNINDMIQLEAKRRSKTTTSQTFPQKERATSTKVKALQDNLATIGFATSKNGSQKTRAMKTMGQELIDKSLEAYKQKIKYS